jgi:amino-acid N-acetyltransferase
MFQAVAPDAPALANALRAEGLPVSDVGKPNQSFFSFSFGDDIIGYVGLERYGDAGLLRSLVVASSYKGQGHGAALVAHAVGQAAQSGITSLWLLTNTARPFFEHLGWQVVDRHAAPDAVSKSEEFASLCPSSATCMTYPRPLLETSL